MNDLILAVASAIADRRLDIAVAAAEIGVTIATLRRHLNGEYVRSDSAAKYRRWLAGARQDQAVFRAAVVDEPAERSADPSAEDLGMLPLPNTPEAPLRVVDLFSGCGGLSLGPELLAGGAHFDTVLAIDIEPAMLRVLDVNRQLRGKLEVGRRVDLSDLSSAAEVLAFYLDHLVRTGQAPAETAAALDALPGGSLASFQAAIFSADHRMRMAVTRARSAPRFREALRSITPESLKQTSVISFHTMLKLPSPTAREFTPPVAWWQDEPVAGDVEPVTPTAGHVRNARRRHEEEWDAAVEVLRHKGAGRGTGQLATSAQRIASFVRLLDDGLYDDVYSAWLEWQTQRTALRSSYFGPVLAELRAAYAPVAVDVLLGGPPCQGFSRIGRGKIRSLRESRVQAHTDDEAGDERNRLLHAYVLVVAALRPRIFMFENVRHFQAEVSTPAGSFRADEVLADSIRDLSDGGVRYGVHAQIVRSSEYGIPQTRERYFMAGVREESSAPLDPERAARWILRSPLVAEVPLLTALEGLPSPVDVSQGVAAEVEVAPEMPVGESDFRSEFRRWIRQPWPNNDGRYVDGHVARSARADDAGWFALMGPGRRWMDYRVDRSDTLVALRRVLGQLGATVHDDPGLANKFGVGVDELRALTERIDGSLAIRLLLESIPVSDGEVQHHLLAEPYLRKREGNHGDWLARLRADRPCKTITSHMSKDAYAYVHPFEPRTLSVREAARVQSFPDGFRFGSVNVVDAYRVVGNAVPPLLSARLGENVARVVATLGRRRTSEVATAAAS